MQMQNLKQIVDTAVIELEKIVPNDQTAAVTKIIESAVMKGMLEGQHRAVDTCNECADIEAEQDIAHKIATAIRRKNDALIANLTSMRWSWILLGWIGFKPEEEVIGF